MLYKALTLYILLLSYVLYTLSKNSFCKKRSILYAIILILSFNELNIFKIVPLQKIFSKDIIKQKGNQK